MSPITVITATIPEREPWLRQLEQSIAAQTHQPHEWLVAVDHDHRGPAPVLNELAAQVDTPWLFRCDDDDLFYPNHFDTIAAGLADDLDVVWSWPDIYPSGHMTRTQLQVNLPLDTLERQNFIASAAAVRCDLWDRLGGLADVDNEDHDMWLRAWRAGARFGCIEQVTWTYRLGGWPHRTHGEL